MFTRFIALFSLVFFLTACVHEGEMDHDGHDEDSHAAEMMDDDHEAMDHDDHDMDDDDHDEDGDDGDDMDHEDAPADAGEEDPADDTEVPDVVATGVYTGYHDGVIGNGSTSVLFFHAAWCPACQKNDGRLTTLFGEGDYPVSVYRVDYDSSDDLKKRYGVVQQDTFVVIDGEGNAVSTKSFPSEADLTAMIQG